ncbi:hypothetical protein [Crassaminicella indica]|uniref:Uncharacterized protein n=1 Tax=Crassaminicella indica TaxID=2855394 RepID=A0ABX8RH17_9CLOT|nr:hypothetical protein [Crassaminicella indica]QXM06246.1 hypothetical protein KVH43_13030 [Crassaminicella indica]
MGKFKDFDLNLKKVKTDNKNTARNWTMNPLTCYTVLSRKYCSDPSTHCSPSDMTACRNAAKPGEGTRC